MNILRADGRIAALSALVGLIGAVVVMVTTHRDGPGISPDSATYLSAADRFVESLRFEGYVSGDTVSAFAPLYPLLLTPGEVLGAPVLGARIVGALAFGLLAAVAAMGAARISGRARVPPALAGAAVLLAAPVVEVASFAWSDVPFALVVSAFLLTTSGIGTHRHSVAAAGTLAAVAILLRYPGVTVLPVGIAAVLLWGKSRSRDAAIFLAAASIPPTLWVMRNELASSTLAGQRHSAADGWEAALEDTARTLGGWFVPDAPRYGALLALALVIVASVSALQRRLAKLEILSAVFVSAYVVTLVVSEATVALDPVDDRLLVPVFVPLIWLVVGTAKRLGSMPASRVSLGLATLGCAAALAAWAWMEVSRYPALIDSVSSASLTRLPAWTPEDERRARSISDQLYTNAPDVIFLRTGTRAMFSPHKSAYRSNDPVDELGTLTRVLAAERDGVLVWFEDVHRATLFTPFELSSRVGLERVTSTESATMYRLTPLATAASR